jgi:hypothetical protein
MEDTRVAGDGMPDIRMDGGRVNAHQNPIVLYPGRVDLLKSQDFIGGAVPVLDYGLHRVLLALAVVGGESSAFLYTNGRGDDEDHEPRQGGD